MKAYITKYALTKGIIESEDYEPSISDSSMISIPSFSPTAYFHKPYWWGTIEEAKAHAELLRKRKIASLNRSIAKLQKLKF